MTNAKTKVGILHPGAMGISVAATIKNSGFEVYWASDNRSKQSHERAEKHHLSDAETLSVLCQQCDILISVCPPHAAEALAEEVILTGFRGLYLDANAIAPQRTLRISEKIQQVGGTFVDGGIIGGPAWEANRTWLYLSGQHAREASSYFASGPLETAVISDKIGDASALKMCFAAYTKGTTALLAAILGTAESLGIRQSLEEQWSRNGSDFSEETQERVRRVTAKAWRFAGEMEEIASTLESAGFPAGFHQAASEIYHRLAHFKNTDNMPELSDVLEALSKNKTS